MVGPDLSTPGAVALLQSQRLDGAVAGVDDAVRLPGFHQCVVYARGELDGNVKLEAKLADIGDPECKQRCPGEGKPLHPAERKAGVRNVVVCETLEHVTRLRA